MQYSEIIKTLNDIEENVPIAEIQYKDLKVWPLVRLEIWKNLHLGVPNLIKTEFSFKNCCLRVKNRILIYLEHLLYKFENKYQRVPVVFLIARLERTIKIEGKYYSRFSNSLQELLKEMNISSITLDLSRKKLPIYGETHFIDRELLMQPIINKIQKIFSTKRESIKHWDELENYINSKFPVIKLDKKNIIGNSRAILDYQQIFEKILKQIKPKVCFLVCYYHPITMSYIRACKKLGIETVDVQHGEQHGMYRGWNKIPKEGYDIMPDLFWCWGEESAREINKWSANTKIHKAFVGGNPWISRLINSRSEREHFLEKVTEVVVAIPNKDYPLEHLFEAIKHAPSNVNWGISLHPMKMRDKIFVEKIKKEFEKTGNKNIKIQSENGPSFYDLLSNADFLVTPWSTAIYEALAFGVHPVVINPDNVAIFENYVNKGLFSFANTSEKILDIIKKDKSEFNFKEETPYIEADRERMKEILFGLMKE